MGDSVSAVIRSPESSSAGPRAAPLAGEALALERTLAVARVFLALVSLAVIYYGSTGTDRDEALTILTGYAAFSGVLLAGLRFRRVVPSWLPAALHAVDVLCASALIVVTDAACSYFLPFFVLLAAANRWGGRETLLTGLAVVASIVVETVPHVRARVGAPTPLGHLLTQGSYFLVVVLLAGYLSWREKTLRAEALATARVMTRAQRRAGAASSLVAELREFAALAGSAEALLATEEIATGRLFTWSSRTAPARQPGPSWVSEVPALRRDAYFFPVPEGVGAWHVSANRAKPAAIDADGHRVAATINWPRAFADEHPSSSLIGVEGLAIEGFQVRLLLLDPTVGNPEAHLPFIQSLARQAAPAVHNLFLLRRIRSRISETERARLARELHDGVIQSLAGIELRLDVAQRSVLGTPEKARGALVDIQRLLREQIVGVRELMQSLRPRDVDGTTLVASLAGATERFGRQTGISAKFVADVETAALPPRACRELCYIVNEALTNVRKHSGATSVAVRFSTADEQWVLAIEDDGRGFGFAGRLAGSELEHLAVGPTIIRERTDSIGGLLTVESRPGQGALVEIRIPRYSYC